MSLWTGHAILTSMAWTWTLLDAAGQPTSAGADIVTAALGLAGQGAAPAGFDSQGDAESFIGEVWRDLLAAGVDSVSLHDGDRLIYTMSLQPPEL